MLDVGPPSPSKRTSHNKKGRSPFKAARSPIKKQGPPTTGLSAELSERLGLGSVTRAKARRARQAATSPSSRYPIGEILIPGVVIQPGCGGAHGVLERQQRNIARFQAKLAAEERARREASLIAEATGGRSVDAWRNDEAESFLQRPPAARAPRAPADAARHQLGVDPASSATDHHARTGKLPPLPPLPRGCAQEKKLRLKKGYEDLQLRRGGYEDFV